MGGCRPKPLEMLTNSGLATLQPERRLGHFQASPLRCVQARGASAGEQPRERLRWVAAYLAAGLTFHCAGESFYPCLCIAGSPVRRKPPAMATEHRPGRSP